MEASEEHPDIGAIELLRQCERGLIEAEVGPGIIGGKFSELIFHL
jgi:hypothetical protein